MALVSRKEGTWVIIILGIICFTFFFFTQSMTENFPFNDIFVLKKQEKSRDGESGLWDIWLNSNYIDTWSSDRRFLIDTSGCQIKNVNAFAEETFRLITKTKSYKCLDRKNVSFGLVHLKDKTLYVNSTIREKVLKHYKATKKNFYCCVDYFKRYFDEINDSGYRLLGDCNKFTDKLDIVEDYMSISCYLPKVHKDGRSIYQNFEFTIQRKSHVESRCQAQEEADRARGLTCADRLSVLILGIDSVSRLQSQRHLNLTRQVLRSMEAIEFVGFNRVAENTYPNMGAAMLAGKESTQLDSECIDKNKFLDNCTFLWDHFQVAGYRTAFVENMNNFGLYTYSRKGFRRQIADYYGRTFFNGVSKLHSSVPDCYRSGTSVSDDEAVVQWAVEFQKEFANDLHFGYFWISVFSHNYMNSLQQVDKFLPKQLMKLAENGGGLLNRTLLVFMSDHGLRFGPLLKTEVGRFEINLPFLYLVFPKWFREKHPKAIRSVMKNARKRLTTHFDLHATLRDIASCRGPFAGAEINRVAPPPPPLRGISLFGPIPENRTCSDAGIPQKYCSCVKQTTMLPANDKRAHTLGQLVVDKLNNMTANLRRLCVRLSLLKVDHLKSHDNTESEQGDNEYVVVLTTSPGNGYFESRITHNSRSDEYNVDNEVTRLNKYGNDSSCIRDTNNSKLYPICLCSQK